MQKTKLKKSILAFISSRMVYNGYTLNAAMEWKEKAIDNFFHDHKTSFFNKIKAYKYGYLPNQMKTLKINNKNVNKYLSYKKYLYLYGANGKYNVWLSDAVTTYKVLNELNKNLLSIYYQLYLRDGNLKIIAIDKKLKNDEISFYDFIKKQKSLVLMYSDYKKKFSIKYTDKKFFLDGNEIEQDKLDSFIKKTAKKVNSLILAESVEPNESFKVYDKPAVIYLSIYNKDGLDPLIGELFAKVNNDDYIVDNITKQSNISKKDESENYSVEEHKKNKEKEQEDSKARIYFDEKTGRFKFCLVKRGKEVVKLSKVYKNEELINLVEKNFKNIKSIICDIFKKILQIEMAEVKLIISNNGIKIVSICNDPEYCNASYFNEDYSEFLTYKYHTKRKLYSDFGFKFKIFTKKVRLKFAKLFADIFYPKGLVPYLSFRWLKNVKDDFFENKNVPVKTKLWAYRHGFLSYRLDQYGITKDNYKEFISDFEYRWLRHINNYYKVWFEDKITIKHIASEYNHLFPKYYYYIGLRQGENKIIPMMDCPRGYKNTYKDIFNLIKKEGDIALKRDNGSHGEGFYRVSYKNNKLYLNLNEATEQDIINILSDKNNEYLVTEYIKQSDFINKIYAGSVNTMRVIVFKADGKTPEVGNVYMRFGSSKTGTVDNIGAGGINVTIDEETGVFHDALIITDDLKIAPCKEHPDTHVPIEGSIPNWEKILNDIKEISSFFEQIEYFGFDVSITDNGIKFPEINRYPDYMKIDKLKPRSMKYLLYKIEQKKKIYGYDKHMPHKLFKFIDRREKR